MRKAIIALVVAGVVITVVGSVGYIKHLRNKSYVNVMPRVEITAEYKVPESVSHDEMSEESSRKKQEYSDTTICATFDEQIRGYCEQAFGEYLPALQDAYKLINDLGYEYFAAYGTDDQYTEVTDNKLELTVYLPGNRARLSITRDGDKYTTSMRILEDSEYLVLDDVEETETSDANYFTVDTSPSTIEGYETVAYDGDLYDISSEILADAFSGDVVEKANEYLGTLNALSAPYIMLNESDLTEATAIGSQGNIRIEYGDYIVDITGTNTYIVKLYQKIQQ